MGYGPLQRFLTRVLLSRFDTTHFNESYYLSPLRYFALTFLSCAPRLTRRFLHALQFFSLKAHISCELLEHHVIYLPQVLYSHQTFKTNVISSHSRKSLEEEPLWMLRAGRREEAGGLERSAALPCKEANSPVSHSVSHSASQPVGQLVGHCPVEHWLRSSPAVGCPCAEGSASANFSLSSLSPCFLWIDWFYEKRTARSAKVKLRGNGEAQR